MDIILSKEKLIKYAVIIAVIGFAWFAISKMGDKQATSIRGNSNTVNNIKMEQKTFGAGFTYLKNLDNNDNIIGGQFNIFW